MSRGPIVFATDMSPVSETAARAAIALANQSGEDLHVIFALEYSGGMTIDASMVDNAARARREADTRHVLEVYCKKVIAGQCNVVRRVLIGSVAEVIATYATDSSASVVVVGTSAPRGMKAVLLGSVADEITRSCPVPVLVVRTDLTLP